MNFRISDTFSDSLGRLSGQEQKAAKLAVFEIQTNLENPGLQFHRIDKAKDPHFWSARVTRDIRIIIHKTEADLLVCYVDHHDKAYGWAEKRKIQQHPATGAIQVVKIRELVQEVPVFVSVEKETPKAVAKPLFGDTSDDLLLGYGVPVEWLQDAKKVTEDGLFELAENLPQEAAEALLELATGGSPVIRVKSESEGFDHPDTQRRFRLISDEAELELALEYPWEKWTIFLHPSQRSVVERNFKGPARVTGSAGTGKTIVALHRAAYLARSHLSVKVLLTTFSDALADLLSIKLNRLVGVGSELRKRITVRSIPSLGKVMYGPFTLATEIELSELIDAELHKSPDLTLPKRLVMNEWRHIFDAWQISDWEAYRKVPRVGMKTRLGSKQRELVFKALSMVREGLERRGMLTWSSVYQRLSETHKGNYTHVIVDEAQDLSVPQLRFLASLSESGENGLFLAGDIGQRIFQHPFSWKSLGIEIQGRSTVLRVNYRTSHQIRRNADRLLPDKIRDTDGNEESRSGTVSVFNGPDPEVKIHQTIDDEIEMVAEKLNEWIGRNFVEDEIGIFVRSEKELPRARAALKAAGVGWTELENTSRPPAGKVAVSSMHLAKGLEFRAVIVMACDDEILPQQERIEAITDEADLEEVYTTERHLLYVACTRVREELFVSGVEPASEFLDDF